MNSHISKMFNKIMKQEILVKFSHEGVTHSSVGDIFISERSGFKNILNACYKITNNKSMNSNFSPRYLQTTTIYAQFLPVSFPRWTVQ